MKEKLSHNLNLKIIAVAFATGLWMISININDPHQSKDYSVVVQLQNMSIMTASGKYVEVIDDSDEITVSVRGSRSVMDSFSSSNIVATADLKELTEDNRVPIRLSTIKTSGSKIESMKQSDEYITVKVEDILRVQKNIEIETRNQPEEGYILGSTRTEQNALRISGPASAVKEVSRAVVTLDLSNAKEDLSMLLPVELYDEEGEKISDSRLTTSISEVQCVAGILGVKEVPVIVEGKGQPAEGYGFTGEILQEPSSVKVAGKSSALRSIQEIRVENILDFTGAKEDVTASFNIQEYIPDNVVLADSSYDGHVSVRATVEKEVEIIHYYPKEDVMITNIPQGFKAALKEDQDDLLLHLKGFASMKEAPEINVGLTADIAGFMKEAELEELTVGEIEIPVVMALPEGIWCEEEVVITIEISE